MSPGDGVRSHARKTYIDILQWITRRKKWVGYDADDARDVVTSVLSAEMMCAEPLMAFIATQFTVVGDNASLSVWKHACAVALVADGLFLLAVSHVVSIIPVACAC